MKPIYINEYDAGKHHILTNDGRTIELRKNKTYTDIEVWNTSAKSRYDADADMHSVTVRNKAVLSDDFFNDIAEIEKAQRMIVKHAYACGSINYY